MIGIKARMKYIHWNRRVDLEFFQFILGSAQSLDPFSWTCCDQEGQCGCANHPVSEDVAVGCVEGLLAGKGHVPDQNTRNEKVLSIAVLDPLHDFTVGVDKC